MRPRPIADPDLLAKIARRHGRGLGRALVDDLHHGARAGLGGLVVAALVEWVATLWADPGSLGVVLALRLLLLDLTLFAVLGVAVIPLCALAATLPRVRAVFRDGRVAAAALPPPLAAPGRWRPAAAPRLLAAGLAVLGYLIVVTWVGRRVELRLREEILSALVMATLALIVGVVALYAGDLLASALVRARAALGRAAPRVARWTLGSPWLVLAVLAVAVIVTLRVTGAFHPHLAPIWPWRRLLTLLAFVVGVGLERELAWRWQPRPRRIHGLALAAVALVLVPLVLVRWGGQPRVKAVAATWSPTLATAMDVLRRATDLDGDGFGSLLGENDCAPRDKRVHPGAVDKPDNGLDENCNGHDFSMRDLVAPSGPRPPVPPAFRKQWNVLFITIDTVRYDHTSFGGRNSGPKPRDTTPNLAKLAARSTSFTFANAPTPGTMGSIPALLTSRYFHSGVALDETNIKPGMPPRLADSNVTLPELFKQRGYDTGAILSHEYFNDWGMDQGVDDYDNSIGATHDPYRVADDKVADRAISWIASHPEGPWFLWTHFIDPHSQYVKHPGEVSFGDSQEDIYHGELRWTDKQVGRLLDQLIKLPGGDRTIVVVTSDHGDGFGEHGFTGHAIALAKELLHVPLIVYVPDNPPREVGGAVSGVDVLPTLAELCGIDVSDLVLEGKSLVPQIFYGLEDRDRAVFAETNYPNPLRSATNTRWKLIFNLKGNFHELYDLVADPTEKVNVASRRKEGLEEMKPVLDAWLERVVFTRDPSHNQVAMKMAKVLLTQPPSPQHPVRGVTLDDGAIEVVGFDVDGARPGAKAKVAVYFRVLRPPTRKLRLGAGLFGLVAGVPGGGEQVRAPVRITLDGLFATDRWQVGDHVRDEWTVALPPTWSVADVSVGLTVTDAGGKLAGTSGPTLVSDPNTVDLGRLQVPVATPPTPPPALPPPPQPLGPAPPVLAPAGKPAESK